MPTLLHLDSSTAGDASVSRRLTARFAAAWTALGAGHTVVRRDLTLDPPPHLPSPGLHWPPALRSPGEQVAEQDDAYQQLLVEELLAADVVLVGAPMYNWSVPSTLKAWIDWVHVPGTTAPFGTPTGPLTGRPAVVVSARGAGYREATGGNPDVQIPALEQLFVAAFGMRMYPVTAELTLASRLDAMAPFVPAAEASLAAAEVEIDRLAALLGSGA
ncbi:FMN-dependent NADH-azoreductase [Nakamurella sp. YIM 132087]|uniref:FMN dependent NADH:quinone oxidoreductase n=1 Tax=Nakamurella alba TaxID=2665158 RepID=A0A7K1FL41_9ACTN|nr:NAD(P)H-dependent oxidoreductase [Nakamurella alba]MTD14780.1 FMN-dependent NADH-azoreductase [Nakamurella alba]